MELLVTSCRPLNFEKNFRNLNNKVPRSQGVESICVCSVDTGFQIEGERNNLLGLSFTRKSCQTGVFRDLVGLRPFPIVLNIHDYPFLVSRGPLLWYKLGPFNLRLS